MGADRLLLVFFVTLADILRLVPLLDGVVPRAARAFLGYLRFSWQAVPRYLFSSPAGRGTACFNGNSAGDYPLAPWGFWAGSGTSTIWLSPEHRDSGARDGATLWPTAADRFSVYLFASTLPHATIPSFHLAKKHLLLADNIIVISSACGMCGSSAATGRRTVYTPHG